MRIHPLLSLPLLVLLLFTTACSKKAAPVTMPETVQRSVEAAPAPAPAPVPANNPVGSAPDIWEGDLADIDAHVRAQGLLGDVHFAFDRYELGAEARERLARNAEFLRARPQFIVSIEGHCDERGTHEYNIALGDRRASSALDYLESMGVERARMGTLSYGEERPQCRESNEGCWWQNRRASFVVSGRVGTSFSTTGGE